MSIHHIDTYRPEFVRYDPEAETLEVEFSNGLIYHYYDVPNELYHQLMSASSGAQFFDQNIRPVFAYARAEGRNP